MIVPICINNIQQSISIKVVYKRLVQTTIFYLILKPFVRLAVTTK